MRWRALVRLRRRAWLDGFEVGVGLGVAWMVLMMLIRSC